MGNNNCYNYYIYNPISVIEKFAWGPLKEVMDKRERDINRDIDEAEEAKLNAQNLKKKIKRHLKKHKMKFIIFLKMQEFKHVNNMKKLLKMHERANGMIETAQSEINSEKERALADINNQVSELSVLIASKVLQKKFQNKIKRSR